MSTISAKKTIILHEEYVTVEYHASLQAVALHWHLPPSSAELRHALNVGLRTVEDKKAPNWVGNTAKLGAIDPDDQTWINEAWFPQLLVKGVKNMAVVVSEDIFGQMSIEDIMGHIDLSTGFESRYFQDVNEAFDWIEKVNAIA
jgi:hypothetical protein